MRLSSDQVTDRLATAHGWKKEGEGITKTYALPSFADAIAFVTRLAFDCEAADHHPDIRINYKKVTLTWSTHSEGGLTDKDFEGAKQSDRIAPK